MNKSLIKIGLLIVTTTLIGIGTVIANSSSRVLATPAEAKMHLDEGIKALQGGDTNGAMTHLKAADDKLSAGQAKIHLDEGIKALQGGDANGAMTHLKAAESALSG